MTGTDWRQAIGGNVSEGFVAEQLNLNEMYILELIESDYQEKVSMTFQGDTQITDRFKTIWQVEGHKTKIWVYFNLPVGYLQGIAGPNERSNVVAFAKRFKPVAKDQPFRLAEYFQDHMRIRAYLKKQEGKDFYNVDLGTVQPFNIVQKPADDPDTVLLKKALALQPNQGEAFKLYKELVPGGDEAKFLILWNMVLAEKGTAAPKTEQKQTGKIIEA